jgi:hypothetical protein
VERLARGPNRPVLHVVSKELRHNIEKVHVLLKEHHIPDLEALLRRVGRLDRRRMDRDA